jgi:hypothetical protein
MTRATPGGRRLALNHRGIKKFRASGCSLPMLPPKFGPTSNSEFVPSPVYVTDFPHALHRFALNPTYVMFAWQFWHG